MDKKYVNPPVVEALCEIFFNGSKWDSTLPGLFYEKVKDTYPKKRELDQIGVEFNISSEMHDSKFMQGNKRLQFIRESDAQLVQIEKDLLVVNQLKPYPGFEGWKPTIMEMLSFYEELAQPNGIRQLGIRYINKIVIPAIKFKMEDYFNLYPQVPEKLGAMHYRFMMRLEIPPKNEGHLLIVTFGTATATPADSLKKTVELLDIYDIFPQSLSIGNVEKHIVDAHENIEIAFENGITEKTRKLFGNESKK